MSVKVVNGDLMNAKEKFIVHQVNCMGVMGAGVAKAIRSKWPIVYTKYKEICDKYEIEKLLGKFLLVYVGDLKIVVNLFSQGKYGTDKQYTDYSAFKDGLEDFFKILIHDSKDSRSVAMPYKIGCGLAGGDWGVIYSIIDNLSKKYDIDVTLYRKELFYDRL